MLEIDNIYRPTSVKTVLLSTAYLVCLQSSVGSIDVQALESVHSADLAPMAMGLENRARIHAAKQSVTRLHGNADASIVHSVLNVGREDSDLIARVLLKRTADASIRRQQLLFLSNPDHVTRA